MAVGLPPTLAVSKALQQIKGGSSKWMKETFPTIRGFAWQDGYGAFAVSKSNMPVLTTYIEKQREHHRTKTFKEEFGGAAGPALDRLRGAASVGLRAGVAPRRGRFAMRTGA
jgi:hypothetical protein